MEVGTVYMFAGSSAPSGFLPCDGSAVSRTTYSTLFDIIGTTYGSGDGSTTFNVPDLSGRLIVGTSSSYTIGSTGGEETHALQVGEMPSHTHSIASHGHAHTIKATTPKLTHTITQPAFNYNKPNGTVASTTSNSATYAGTTSTTATRSASVAISNHSAAACTKSGSVTDCNAFNMENNGSGTAHSNMQPYMTMMYIIYTGDGA